jgi:hypothetical protein
MPIRLHILKEYAVAMEEADKFTTLLQIRIVLSKRCWSSISFNTSAARLLFSSASARIRNLLTVVSAVSAEEKNADSAMSAIITIMFIASLGSNKNHLQFKKIYMW